MRYVRVAVDVHDVTVVRHLFERQLRDELEHPPDFLAQVGPALNRNTRRADIAVASVEQRKRVLCVDLILLASGVESSLADSARFAVSRVEERQESEAMRLTPATMPMASAAELITAQVLDIRTCSSGRRRRHPDCRATRAGSPSRGSSTHSAGSSRTGSSTARAARSDVPCSKG